MLFLFNARSRPREKQSLYYEELLLHSGKRREHLSHNSAKMLKLALRPRPPLQPHSTPCSQQRCVQCLQDPQPRCAADPQPRRAEGRTSRLRLLMPVITWSKTLSDSTCSLSWCSEQLCLPKTRTLAVSSRRRMVPDKASPLMTFRGTKVEIIYLEYNQSCFFIYFEKRRRDRWV